MADAADAGQISMGAEAGSLVALAIRVRCGPLIAPPSPARARAAALAAVVLPILLIIPAARTVDLGLPLVTSQSELSWRWSALVPAWIAAVLAGLLVLFGAVRWAHRSSIAAVVLFVGGLLVLVTTTNLDAAVRESGWLPLLATSAALNRHPQRVRAGRRLLGTTGLAVVAVLAACAAVIHVAAGPNWTYSTSALLPAPMGVVFYNSRLVLGGLLVLICLAGLVSRTARAAIPVVAAIGMVSVGAELEANLWPNSDVRYDLLIGLPVGHLLLQLVVAPIVVFLVARALTALVDRVGRSRAAEPLSA